MELHERLSTARPVIPAAGRDPFAEVKNRIHLAVIGDLGPQLFNANIEPFALRDRVTAEIGTRLTSETGISKDDRDRLASEIAAERAFRRVVLPEPVPPEMRTLSSPSTERLRKSTVSGPSVPSRISSSRSSRLLLNFRIVTSGPLRDSGGITALTRLPSGSRASTIGDDSSMRRPTCATILLMIRRRCDSSLNWTLVW